ncbi:hypothetical protein H6P81_019707 [Aristolochia fimbriata]|uniref:carnosine N-methyltransferase n=1 Tax=Aristolochia fimbriata TaxID=158543 RepID=A0AAV7DWC3_ARIFI|nr:hypothetical protein H6P81_019707 [Aristolochia fimbriata]
MGLNGRCNGRWAVFGRESELNPSSRAREAGVSSRQWKRGEEMASASERTHSKLEEALEVKSLRRIISAYLNYPDAAEADVRRYERSFKKLPPEHKALLCHLPLKFQRLRRCISINSYFIFNMLQAFEPPLDMSQDIDICDERDLRNYHDLKKETNFKNTSISCGHPASPSERINYAETAEDCDRGKEEKDQDLPQKVNNEEVHMENCLNSCSESGSVNSESNEKVSKSGDGIQIANGNANSSSHDWLDPSLQLNVPLVDVDKVRCIIRNIVRDWASEGRRERDQCYKPILEELVRLFPQRSKASPPSCLVPGAGLGRLALEISRLGFICQGNEFSYYMMICSSYILNQTQAAGEWTIYPWIHSNCNSLSDNDQLRPVTFPDIHPASAGITEGFSMCGGDFVEVYNDASQEGSWDAVVTCFFLDTAHNIVEYIEIISRILKDGGVWINLGPLLYHFADAYGEDEMSIEISLEDVKKIAFHYGFSLELEETIETTYTVNPRSMMQNHYFAAFWTMRKGKAT